MTSLVHALGATACLLVMSGCGQRAPAPPAAPDSAEPELTQTAPDDSTYTGSAGRKEDTAAAVDSASADAAFIRSAAESDLLEVELGQLAREKAVSRDVREYAAMLVQDHRKTERELQRLANDMGVAVPGALTSAKREQLERLRAAGGDAFDRAFARQTLRGHREAVEMYERAARSALEADVRAYASERLPTLREHLRLAQALPGAESGG